MYLQKVQRNELDKHFSALPIISSTLWELCKVQMRTKSSRNKRFKNHGIASNMICELCQWYQEYPRYPSAINLGITDRCGASARALLYKQISIASVQKVIPKKVNQKFISKLNWALIKLHVISQVSIIQRLQRFTSASTGSVPCLMIHWTKHATTFERESWYWSCKFENISLLGDHFYHTLLKLQQLLWKCSESVETWYSEQYWANLWMLFSTYGWNMAGNSPLFEYIEPPCIFFLSSKHQTFYLMLSVCLS